MRAVYKREIYSLFVTPHGYIYGGVFALVMNLFFNFANIGGKESDLDGMFTFALTVLMFTVPVLTMRGFSEEYRRGTDRLLFTAPVKPGSIVAGKFWAVMTVLGGTFLLITFVYAEIIILFGALNFSEYIGNMIAILTFAAVYVAMGLFISALTRSQTVSIFVTLGAFVVLLLLDVAADIMPSSLIKSILSSLSIFRRFDSFSRGLFSIADIVFVASVCVVFLVLTAVALHRRRHGFKGRRLQLAAVMLPALAVLVAVNLFVGEMSSRLYLKYDMTRSKIFALTSHTTSMLSDLPEIVTMTLLTNPESMSGSVVDEETGAWYHLADVREFLEKYRAASNGNLKLQYIDPDINPNWIRERDLTDKAGYYSIIVESDRRTRVVSLWELFETQTILDFDGEPLAGNLMGLRAEQALTSAVLNVITEVLPKAAILTGHGEYPAEYLAWIMTLCNYDVETVNITSGEIPDGTELLVLAIPMYDFTEQDLTKLDKYLSGGGNAIIAFDPVMPELPALELYLTEWGARFEHAYVLDADMNYGNNQFILPVIDTQFFDGLSGGGGRYLLAVGARPLTPLWETDGSRVITPFIWTYDTAYAKIIDIETPITSLDEAEGDLSGSFVLGAVCEQLRANGASNMVVFLPCSVIADAALSYPNFLNYQLAVSLLSMARPEVSLDIPPRDITYVPLAINSREAFLLSFVLLAVIPLIPAAAGIGTWFRRRKL
ncbi:MAG: Gldg family protein [Oscillospiraceae bacterium]|nr:Gldg family protein [Oscillospiraceae bacterium]